MTDSDALTILIADDEPLAAERLQMLLARIEGIHLVGTAHDGESAVRMAEALTPDVLLLDIAMPGLDGIEVARALSRQGQSPESVEPRKRPATKALPCERNAVFIVPNRLPRHQVNLWTGGAGH